MLAPLERGRVRIERDPGGGATTVEVVRNLGALHIHDVDIDLTALGNEVYTVVPSDPATSRAVARRTAAFGRGDWRVRVETASTLTFEEGDWQLESSIEASEGGDGAVVFARTWKARFPRDGSL